VESEKDYVTLRQSAKAFYDQKGLGNSAFKKDMYEYYQIASGKIVQVKYDGSGKTDSDKVSAAEGYISFATEFPKVDNAPKALNIAANFLKDTNNIAKAIDVRLKLVGEYSANVDIYKNSIRFLGVAYKEVADYKNAASWFEKLYEVDSTYEDSEGNLVAKEALFASCKIREFLGEWQKAISNKQEFMKTYSSDPRVAAMPYDIAKLYQKNGKTTEAIKAYSKYYQKPPAGASKDLVFDSRLQHSILLIESSKVSDANKVWKSSISAYDKMVKDSVPITSSILWAVGEMKYNQITQSTKKYYSLKIDAPKGRCNQRCTQKHLTTKIKAKKDALKALNDSCDELIMLGGEKFGGGKWSIAAAMEKGKAQENYGVTIKGAFVPSYLSEGAQEIFSMQLEDQAYPYVQKAIELYGAVLTVANNNDFYTDASAYAAERLGILKPEDYPSLDEELLQSDYLSVQSSERSFVDKAE
jgi:tetratricopeptide (TPR) repeat protein